MIVVTLSDCPPKLRGDLSKWLCEINTGVYVGNLNTRVRQELWERICENLRNGRATMVFSAAGEQRMDFYVHNTTWEPVDFDGLKLMRRPLPKSFVGQSAPGNHRSCSNAAKFQRIKEINTARLRNNANFTILDVETTGLNPAEHALVELGALRIRDGKPTHELSVLVKQNHALPQAVTELTGITSELCEQQGVALTEALRMLSDFIGTDTIYCFNAPFDCGFLRAALRRCEQRMFGNDVMDVLTVAKRKVKEVENYQLSTLARHFTLDTSGAHRALADCKITYALLMKLKEAE